MCSHMFIKCLCFRLIFSFYHLILFNWTHLLIHLFFQLFDKYTDLVLSVQEWTRCVFPHTAPYVLEQREDLRSGRYRGYAWKRHRLYICGHREMMSNLESRIWAGINSIWMERRGLWAGGTTPRKALSWRRHRMVRVGAGEPFTKRMEGKPRQDLGWCTSRNWTLFWRTDWAFGRFYPEERHGQLGLVEKIILAIFESWITKYCSEKRKWVLV